MQKTDDLTLVGRRIKKLRNERGWSQKHLARLAGCDQKSISNLERRSLGIMTGSTQMETVSLIAAALDVPLWLLLLPVDDAIVCDLMIQSVVRNYAQAPQQAREAMLKVSELSLPYT